MAKGDQYRCDWCNFSWRTTSDSVPLRCTSCGNGNITNQAQSLKDMLGEENILDVKNNKEKTNLGEGEISEEIEEGRSFMKKIINIFKK